MTKTSSILQALNDSSIDRIASDLRIIRGSIGACRMRAPLLQLAITLLLAHMYLETKTTALVGGLEVASIKFLNSVAERRVEPQRTLTPGQVSAQLAPAAGAPRMTANRA